MNGSPGFDRRLTAWLDDQAPPREPGGLLEAVTGRLARTRRIPGWASLERWLPMQTRAMFGAVPRTAIILIVIGMLLALYMAVTIAGQPDDVLPANGVIAFDEAGDIKTVRPNGTDIRTLVGGPEFDTAPVWSPDGKRLAFWTTLAPEPETDPVGSAGLGLVDADGGGLLRLTPPPPIDLNGVVTYGAPSHNNISWSPDGKYLYLLGENPASGVLYDVEADIWTDDAIPGFDGVWTFRWSPSGDRVALIVYGTIQVATMEALLRREVVADRATRTTLNGSLFLLETLGGDGSTMTIEWSPDGRSITYSTAANAEPGVPIDLYVLDTDTGTTRMILEGGLYVLPAWSPAGDRIAFASDETIGAGRGRLHLVDPDGGHHVELSTDLVNPYLLSWSPDGRRLLSSPADSMDLLIVDPSTSIGPIRVARSDPYGAPSWQPLP